MIAFFIAYQGIIDHDQISIIIIFRFLFLRI